MSELQTYGRPTWPFEPLYQLLHEALPAWRTPSGILDVQAVADHIGISSQAIYKWFHRGKLPAIRARQLHSMAHTEANVQLLGDSGVPELVKFYEFAD